MANCFSVVLLVVIYRRLVNFNCCAMPLEISGIDSGALECGWLRFFVLLVMS